MLTTHENRGAQRPAGCEYSAATTPQSPAIFYRLLDPAGQCLGTFEKYGAAYEAQKSMRRRGTECRIEKKRQAVPKPSDVCAAAPEPPKPATPRMSPRADLLADTGSAVTLPDVYTGHRTIIARQGLTRVRRGVYFDTSTRGKRNKNRNRHKEWRADVTITDARGLRRIRRRFKSRKEAEKWLAGY